ncbi:MAG TPA: LysM peptidoglycan-binding domain-containing protein [Desulfuromonadaceae bacterium]|jgi:LysM repeat protein
MKKTVAALLLLALALVLPGPASAAEQDEPTIYVIKKGDTLWGLSEKFLKDPFYWPDMWSKNNQITNPHLIYPGQKVRVFPDRIEIVPKEEVATGVQNAAAGKAAEISQEVSEEKIFTLHGSEGYLLGSEITPAGYIVGAHHDRIVAGEDDIVFTDIGLKNGAKPGDKFSIFQKGESVSHPFTNEIMGNKIVPLGMLQLTDVEQKSSRAIISRSFKEVSPGSYLLPYTNGKHREVALKMTSRDLKGYVIESYSGANTIAAGDIVYIDLGTAKGAEPGNLLYVVRDVVLDQRYVQGRVEHLPQELVGALVILETGTKTSMAIVVKSIDAIYKGDKIASRTR